MSLSDLDDDVLEALRAERERPSPLDDAAKRRVTARLVGSLGGLAGGVALASALGASAGAAAKAGGSIASGASRAALVKLTVVALVAFGAGAGAHAVVAAPTHATSPHSSVVAAPTSAPSPGESAAVVGAASNPTPPSPVVPTVSVETLPEAPKVSATGARMPSAPELRLRERALLEAAQSALARGNADEALETAKRHAAEFPKSELAEEREAIRTRALAKAGRCVEARAAVARFVVAYPSSLQRASLERLCPESTP